MSRRIGVSGGETKEADSSSDSMDHSQEKQRMLLGSNSGHFSMIRALHLADLITELNGLCGVMSIFSSIRFCLDPDHPHDTTHLWFALALMPFGLFFDFMDGKVARWRRKSSLMGQELDSLADLISFGLAPSVLAFSLGVRTPLDSLLLAFFVLCGLSRLARFNVTVSAIPKDVMGKSMYFEGTPIPTTMSIAACMAYWTSRGWYDGRLGLPGGVWGSGSFWEFHPVVFLFVLSGCAMVSRSIHIPKP